MSRKDKGLDLSLAKRRYKEKERREVETVSKREKEGIVKRNRGIIPMILLCFTMGAGTGLFLTKAKVPIDGQDSPKIPLIQKFKYDISDWWKGIHENDADKTEEEIEVPKKQEDKSKIKIDLKPSNELDCKERGEDCLIS